MGPTYTNNSVFADSAANDCNGNNINMKRRHVMWVQHTPIIVFSLIVPQMIVMVIILI